jgi:SAM-dependent methyltransferase
VEAPGEWPLIDASRPSGPRIYDYFLGGKDNFAADRAKAEELEEQAQEAGASVRELVKANRMFVLKAVQWSASMLGTGQFLDLGCGLPRRTAVHDAARDGYDPARDGYGEAKVVYVDNDPMVVSHAAALMAGPGLAAVLADASDPASVLGDEAVGGLLDFSRPVCVILGGTLSAMDPETARAAVAGYAGAMARGSAVIISCVSYGDPELAARMQALFGAAGDWRNHLLPDVESFFAAANLRLIRGRVADVKTWPMLPLETAGASVIGGIGVKP